jgi:L-2-hydroxyglutarate oxidase LhgO
MIDRIDCAIVGAGVVGLAVARKLAMDGRGVVVLEAENKIGTHASSRNSEVIHAGIYYAPGSLKAKLCVRGRQALYEYCESGSLPYQRLGKIIVAVTEGEVSTLERYMTLAKQNGVDDLVWLTGADVKQMEPAVSCVRAILSPSTGIVDSGALMSSFKTDAQAHGAQVVLSSRVIGGEARADGIDIQVGGVDPTTVRCRTVINSAGLFAQSVARSIRGLDARTIPAACFAKGQYFVLSGRSPFSRLVYPIARPGFLGIHATLDLGGQTRFGPDITWTDGVDYRFDETRAGSFYRAVREYFPGLADGALMPGYAGVRPKLGPEGTDHDFVIQGPRDHGVAGLVNLYGIESPGLTSCLAIADEVARLV